MPGCVLHASNGDFDVDAFLRASTLKPYRVFHRGEPAACPKGSNHEDSGFCVDVSTATDLRIEVNDAIQFIQEHEAELLRLAQALPPESVCLDFGHYQRDVAVQVDRLPPALLRLAVMLGIGITLSMYPPASHLRHRCLDTPNGLPLEQGKAGARTLLPTE
jgi:hypothetical protein